MSSCSRICWLPGGSSPSATSRRCVPHRAGGTDAATKKSFHRVAPAGEKTARSMPRSRTCARERSPHRTLFVPPSPLAWPCSRRILTDNANLNARASGLGECSALAKLRAYRQCAFSNVHMCQNMWLASSGIAGCSSALQTIGFLCAHVICVDCARSVCSLSAAHVVRKWGAVVRATRSHAGLQTCPTHRECATGLGPHVRRER